MRITKSNLNTYKIIKLTLNLKNKKALLQRIQEQERKLTQMALELKKEKEQRHEKSLKRTYTRIWKSFKPDDRDNLKTLFEVHKINNERLEIQLKEIGKWCGQNLSLEQLKEIFPKKAQRIEKELKYQRAFENTLEQTKTKRNDKGFGFNYR